MRHWKKSSVAFVLACSLTVGMFGTVSNATELTTDNNEIESTIDGTEEAVTTETSVEEATSEKLNDSDVVTEDGMENSIENSLDTQLLSAESENEPDDEEKEELPAVTYMVHRQTYGNTEWVGAGKTAGTVGESKRLEAISMKVSGVEGLGISYRTHVQTYGWQDWKNDGDLSGTTGESKRLEAIQIKLTGEKAKDYSVFYRVHAQTYGWLDWACNGNVAGTANQAKRLEAIEVIIVPNSELTSGEMTRAEVIQKYSDQESLADCGTTTPSVIIGKYSTDEDGTAGLVNYYTHVQTYGNQNWVSDSAISGTYGESKRLEAISIKLGNTGYEGGIQYKTHVQTYGWQDWVSDGEPSGTEGEAKRLEAIQIELTGEVADHYDVCYRVHVQKFGWLNWARNGEPAGSEGFAYRLEGIQIVLVPKGEEVSETSVKSALGTVYQGDVSFLDKNNGVAAVLAYAYAHLGAPYRYGGADINTGVDCSGFTMLCYQQIGINLPHQSDMQGNCGREVKESELQPGDLIIYNDHVALYVGDGQIIHASTPQSGVKLSKYNYKPIKKIVRIVG